MRQVRLLADWSEDSDASPSTYVNDTATITQSTSDVVTFDATVPDGHTNGNLPI